MSERVVCIQRIIDDPRKAGASVALRFGGVELKAKHGDIVAYGYEGDKPYIDLNGERHYGCAPKTSPPLKR